MHSFPLTSRPIEEEENEEDRALLDEARQGDRLARPGENGCLGDAVADSQHGTDGNSA
jgi:hypothetical protein